MGTQVEGSKSPHTLTIQHQEAIHFQRPVVIFTETVVFNAALCVCVDDDFRNLERPLSWDFKDFLFLGRERKSMERRRRGSRRQRSLKQKADSLLSAGPDSGLISGC